MEANVYSQQTFSAREKFTLGQTTASLPGAILVYVQETRFLAKWISRSGVKASKIEEATGITKGYISQLCNPEKYKKQPSIDTLRKIGDFLGVHYSAFEFDPDSQRGRMYAAMWERKAGKR